MKLKMNHLPYIANKIALDLSKSNCVDIEASIEAISKLTKEQLEENIKKEIAIDTAVNKILDENIDEIEFLRADERALFYMVKKQVAAKEEFHLNWEDRYNDLAHKILDELILEGYIRAKVSENMVKNLIYKAIDTYANLYDQVEGDVLEKMKNYKRNFVYGSEEYELIFNKLYEEELKRRGFN